MKKINNIIYLFALKFIANRINKGKTRLTVQYLIDNGWLAEYDRMLDKTFYFEPNIKDRDKTSVEFDGDLYRVWHGAQRTFIALETSVEWLQVHLLLIDTDRQFLSPDEIVKQN